MKLSLGIVGLPNVGKSTLFGALTSQPVNIANYPFATIDPNIGVVSVPDTRLDQLAALSVSAKIIPAVVEFYDIAGLVKGASQGEGLGNQFLANIRETNAIIQVVRCFASADIIHVDGGVDPVRDVKVVNLELIFKDLETIEKRLDSLTKESRTGDKRKLADLEIAKTVKASLLADQLVNSLPEAVQAAPVIRELNLLTAKPQLYLLNGVESDIPAALTDYLASLNADWLIFDLSLAPDLSRLIQKSYAILGLISFFTTGSDETRAWTIKAGTRTPAAAGAIHTDFERKFIRAEVINWQKLVSLGGWTKAKQAGALRLEGKEYIVADGDVMEIRHG